MTARQLVAGLIECCRSGVHVRPAIDAVYDHAAGGLEDQPHLRVDVAPLLATRMQVVVDTEQTANLLPDHRVLCLEEQTTVVLLQADADRLALVPEDLGEAGTVG